MAKVLDLDRIMAEQRKITEERDWQQFHTPKNLTMALAGEAGELLEVFQWMKEEESFKVMSDEKKALAVRDELADILYYAIRLADVLQIDLDQAFWDKLQRNVKKYPVHLSKGNAKKYTELKEP